MPCKSDQEAINCQEERLKAQEEKAMAKILCLKKQRALLKKRQKEMTYHSVQFLKELDVLEEKERKEKEEQEQEATTMQPTSFNALFSKIPQDPSQEVQGFACKTLQASQGS